jgi:hypothetical protein
MPNKPDDGGEPADQRASGFDAKAWKREYQRLYMKKWRERRKQGKARTAQTNGGGDDEA